MDRLIITGPAHLSGEVKISRSKNAYLPILAACLLTPKPVHLKNLPNLKDIRSMLKLLENLGVKVQHHNSITTIDASRISSYEATYEQVKTMRASILVLGPLLARFGQAKVSLPGGCAIGARPIDLHLKNLKKMGAVISLEGGYVNATVEKFIGRNITLSFPSVGASENVMMAAALAKGQTIIENIALEPEVEDLARFLQAIGCTISGIGTSRLAIEGFQSEEDFKEAEYEAIGDRIEAGTYLIAALMTNSSIRISGIKPHSMSVALHALEEMGAQMDLGEDFIDVRPSDLKWGKIQTAPYPGYPTDLQAQLMVLATKARGASIITEDIFENRFMHVSELRRMGAAIELMGNTAIVQGNTQLVAAPVMCTDLRASAALVIAALGAMGTTEIQRVYHLDRGYENLDEKLRLLGVAIERINPGEYL